LSALQAERKDAVLVTLFSLKGDWQPGTSFLCRENGNSIAVEGNVSDEMVRDAHKALKNKISGFENYSLKNQTIDAFLEFIHPPVSLIIAGAGNDAQPLAEMAYLLGWEVTIADGRPTYAVAHRFPNANRVLVAKPDQLLSQINMDAQTAFVLMTHNYNYDLELLGLLLNTNATYIGSLGPRTKLIRMLDELKLNTDEYSSRVHGPVGLDIGAETAEEIAVSIIAEIKAVFAGTSARSLKVKKEPIHFYQAKNN
jgi:xanthine/CO dehydrogenase XdhC/CoxF family maturation factor